MCWLRSYSQNIWLFLTHVTEPQKYINAKCFGSNPFFKKGPTTKCRSRQTFAHPLRNDDKKRTPHQRKRYRQKRLRLKYLDLLYRSLVVDSLDSMSPIASCTLNYRKWISDYRKMHDSGTYFASKSTLFAITSRLSTFWLQKMYRFLRVSKIVFSAQYKPHTKILEGPITWVLRDLLPVIYVLVISHIFEGFDNLLFSNRSLKMAEIGLESPLCYL